MNEIEKKMVEVKVPGVDLSTVESGTLRIYPIYPFPGRNGEGWIRLLAKAKGPPSLPLFCFLLRGKETGMTRCGGKEYGKERRGRGETAHRSFPLPRFSR